MLDWTSPEGALFCARTWHFLHNGDSNGDSLVGIKQDLLKHN